MVEKSFRAAAAAVSVKLKPALADVAAQPKSSAEILQQRLKTYEQPFLPRKAEGDAAPRSKKHKSKTPAGVEPQAASTNVGQPPDQSKAQRRNARRARIRQQKNAAAA